ncbi:sigma-70 family RNA polymerase sigma factor [Pseudomonas sp. SA3-5]|uniref:Sigma-70 family RNA polymerase sigma factor n=1 Tax=Pseudomonas aestuarii TaxID=3018340 RepID=A0ABT4XFX5_9PSED|nr:sigma-70 family RNA polymerase sigma factor [Pseudomonas aestuarii]MDA7087128.1 sigma-70 family RNA polymerase sigma factor [Pseudomonas aestuarii]
MSLPESFFDYEACLRACARDERQALLSLYEQESGRLLGVARRIVRDDALAEDIVHDAFIKIWTRAGSFDPARGSARGWIFSVTRHLALNFMRDTAREMPLDEPNIADAGESVSTFDLHDGSGRIHGCLAQLEPARRSCILYAYIDGYSHAEISRKLGTPLGTVKAWIKRSLVALRECMG